MSGFKTMLYDLDDLKQCRIVMQNFIHCQARFSISIMSI